MDTKNLVEKWFQHWEYGTFSDLPLADTFRHTSPYGTIEGKQAYLNLVEANRDQFLGYHFEIHDTLYEKDKACIRYTAIKDGFNLNVSEWHYMTDGKIREIVAYYHIGGNANEKLQKDYLK